MKEELMALQELYKETIKKYNISYSSAAYVEGLCWIDVKINNEIVPVNDLEEGEI